MPEIKFCILERVGIQVRDEDGQPILGHQELREGMRVTVFTKALLPVMRSPEGAMYAGSRDARVLLVYQGKDRGWVAAGGINARALQKLELSS